MANPFERVRFIHFISIFSLYNVTYIYIQYIYIYTVSIYIYTIVIFGQHHVLYPCLDPAKAAGRTFLAAGIAHLARPALCLRGDVWLDGEQ